MQRIGRILNLLVASGLTLVSFLYSFSVLASNQVDPRENLQRMSQMSGYWAFLAGFIFLFFAARSLAEFGYPLFSRVYNALLSLALTAGAFTIAYLLFPVSLAAAAIPAALGLAAGALTVKLCRADKEEPARPSPTL